MLAVTDAVLMTAGPRGTVRGNLLIRDGRIAAVGAGDIPAEAEHIDARGRAVTPGFVDAHSHVGISAGLFGGGDGNEDTSAVNPHLRIIDSFDPYDDSVGDALWGGVTTLGLLPGRAAEGQDPLVEQTGLVAGQGAVLHLQADGAARVHKSPSCVKFALGDHPKHFNKSKKTPPYTRMDMLAKIRQLFAEARQYMDEEEEPDPGQRLRLEPVAALLRGELTAAIHAHRRRDILAALSLVEEFSLDAVLHHVTEGHLTCGELAAAQVPCAVGPICMTRRGPELRNINLANPAILERAGVEVALITDHPSVPSNYLPVLAGMAVREGMSDTAALAAVTKNAAEMLGAGDEVGTLEEGKRADLVMHSGDPLDAMSRVELVVCAGQKVRPGLPGESPSLHDMSLARRSKGDDDQCSC